MFNAPNNQLERYKEPNFIKKIISLLSRYCLAIGTSLFVLAVLVPDHYYPWMTFHSELVAFIALLLISTSILSFKSTKIPLPAIFIIGIASIPILQFFFGIIIFLGDAYIVFIFLFSFAISVIVGANLSSKKPTHITNTFAWACVIAATISSFMAAYQWLELNYLNIWIISLRADRPYANLAQPNHLALLTSAGLISTAYFYESKKLTAFSMSCIATLLTFCLVLTASKTTWLIMSVFLFWWLLTRKKLNLRLSLKTITIWILAYYFFWQLLPLVDEAIFLDQRSSPREIAAGSRPIFWRQLFDALLQGPLWGYGWNQVSFAQVSVAANNYPPSRYVEHSHNILLDIVLWNGPMLGTIIVMSACYWAIKQALSCHQLTNWYWLCCLAALLAHSMVEYPFTYAYFLFPAGLALGAAYSFETNDTQLSSPRWFNIIVVGICSVLLVITYKEYQLIEKDSRLVRFESARIGSLKSNRLAPDVHLLSQLSSYIALIRTEAKPDMSEDELLQMQQIAHRYAYPPALFRYILALAYNDRKREAINELKVLKGLHGEEIYNEAITNLQSMNIGVY